MPNLQTIVWMCGKTIHPVTQTTVNATTLKCNVSSMFQTFSITEFYMLLIAPAPTPSRIFTKKEVGYSGKKKTHTYNICFINKWISKCKMSTVTSARSAVTEGVSEKISPHLKRLEEKRSHLFYGISCCFMIQNFLKESGLVLTQYFFVFLSMVGTSVVFLLCLWGTLSLLSLSE